MSKHVLLHLTAALLCTVFTCSSYALVVTNSNDAGAGSLRQAILDAPSGDTITFAAALEGQTILLTNGQFTVDRGLTIDASALTGGVVIDGNANGRIFEFVAGTTNVLAGLTLTNGLASGTYPDDWGGAIYVANSATLTLTRSTLSGNVAASGGGLANSGTATLNHSTLSGNLANPEGGGIINHGVLTLNHSTLSGNSASLGGGIVSYSIVTLNHSALSGNSATISGGGLFNAVTATLNHSTLSSNSASESGGGILNTHSGTVTLNSSTLSGNDVGIEGGGIVNYSGTVILDSATLSGNVANSSGGGIYSSGTLNSTNAIIAGNTAPANPDIDGLLSAGANNLTNGLPLLAPLGDYGGPTQTMLPLPGSPAIDAGGTTLTNDQRGFARVVNGNVDIGAVEAGTPLPGFVPTVNVPSDTVNGLENTNVSLRAAILFAANGSTISFTPTLSNQTILLTNGQLTVDKDLTIDASALADGVVIDGNANGRIFEFAEETTNILAGLTLTNGLASGTTPDDWGGAIYVGFSANLTLTHSTLSGNVANRGGGLFNWDDGTVTLNHSTLSGNVAHNDGGGIYTWGGGGTVTLNHSILSGNLATNSGGGGIYIFYAGTATLNSSTLSGNVADWAGGIYNGGTLTLNRSTLSGNVSNGDAANSFGGGIANAGIATLNSSTLSGNVANFGGGLFNDNGSTGTLNHATLSGNAANSFGGGIFSSGTVTLNSTNTIIAANTAPTSPDINGLLSSGSNNLTNGNPLLAPLGDYGGPTLTMHPLPGSPAVEAGLSTAQTEDQRGYARPNGPLPDIGAVEAYGFDSLGLADSEPDGIPDILEGPDGPYTHLTVGVDDSGTDTDGDGSTDAEEIYNMTDLHDPADYFRILSFGPASGFHPDTNLVFDITFTAFPGLIYSIENDSSVDFDAGAVLGLPAPTDFTHTETIQLQNGNEFVRMQRE